QALVANQVVCVEFCFFFIHPEMIRFLGWGCVTSEDNTGKLYSTIGICVKADGTWYLSTPVESTGSGHWSMNGNDIHLHGNLHLDLGLNESVELTKINQKLLTGYWQEWVDDGSFNLYTTTKWAFASTTCLPPA
ncbi:MAG: hypothetical protein Q8N96_03200, partial [Methylovulum sp.]|nr:hypothetical protein [Methylovulum sp.]